MKLNLLVSVVTLVSCQLAWAHPVPTPPEMPKAFAPLKTLVGTWTGTITEDGKEKPVTVEYKLTSGGSILVETLFPGTPEEMVSIYHKHGKSLAMTHYCSMGNQPEMVLKKASATSLAFEMTKPVGISSPKEMHMHAVTLTLDGPDALKQEWTNYTDGKPAGTVVFNYKRKK